MAQLTQPVLRINGTPLGQFTSFSLNQSIDGYLVQVKPLEKFQTDKQGYFRKMK